MLLLMSTVIKSTGFVFNYIGFHMVGIQLNSLSSSIFVPGSKKKGEGGNNKSSETLECLRDQLLKFLDFRKGWVAHKFF